MSRPLLFLDVDGPLNPYAAKPHKRPVGSPWTTGVTTHTAPLQDRPDGVHWKTAHLVEYAHGRPFAWVDDEQGDRDRAYVAAHHRAPGLLHHVNPRIGLRDDDFRALADFARSRTVPGPGARGE
ncbi:hypothetical protein [Streptomyces sp. NPDC019793]|uniref:hypothetical protein n=1 Tax=unclassified Streptomyces TaxID=2593676 RepID=UPI0033D06155